MGHALVAARGLCDSAVSRLELPRAVARRYHRLHHLSGGSDRLFEDAPSRARGCKRRAASRALALLVAVDHSQPRGLHLEHGRREEEARLPHLHPLDTVRRFTTSCNACLPSHPMEQAPEKAEFKLNLLSATGTGIFVSALIAASSCATRSLEWRGFTSSASGGSATRSRPFPRCCARLRDEVFRLRCHARPRFIEDRLDVSLLRHAARLARRGAHGIRHVIECDLRQPADHHRQADRIIRCSWPRRTAPAA